MKQKIKIILSIFLLVIIVVGGFFIINYFITCPGQTFYITNVEGTVTNYIDLNETIMYKSRECNEPEILSLYQVNIKIPHEERFVVMYDNQSCECIRQNYTNKTYLIAFGIGEYYEYQLEDFPCAVGNYVKFTGTFSHTGGKFYRVWHYEIT